MSYGFPQLAALRVSGEQDNTGATAFERTGVTREIEIGLLFVRVMALGTIRFDKRKDVFLIIDLVLRASVWGAANKP
jgi:hypothetical protein